MKRLLIAILAIMLLSGLAFAGNKPGFMTTDQKDALDGADTPSASNVLATMDDVGALDTGVQHITAGINLTNSGTADSPIIDLDDNITVDTIVERTVGAGVTIEGTDFENNNVHTGSIQIDKNSGAVVFVNLPVDAGAGAGVEQSYVFQVGNQTVLKIYGESDGAGSIQNYWVESELSRLVPRAVADSPINPQEGCAWFDSTEADSGLCIYHAGAWRKVTTTTK